MSHSKSVKLSQQTQGEDVTRQDHLHHRSLNTISRMFDNHWDHNIHSNPWIALGTVKTQQVVTYEHSDAGLSFNNIKIKKLHTFKELWEKNQEIKDKGAQHQGFRQFREYEDIQEEDIIITIEYCTNCHNHTGSTRHSEQQYYDTAVTLKRDILKRFPICKVYLKPLLYDPADHSIDTMFLQRRLGCFEVQILSKQQGQLKNEVIFSKLITKSWPDHKFVISSLPKYFKKCTLTIQLKFENQNQITDQAQLELMQTKLRNVVLNIYPVREISNQSSQFRISSNKTRQSQSNTMPKLNNSMPSPNHVNSAMQSPNFTSKSMIVPTTHQKKSQRPWSSQSRPKSSYSTMSVQTSKTQKTRLLPLNDQTVIMEEMNITDKTNVLGQIILRDIPIDVYEVSIQETNDYKSEKKKIDIFEILNKNASLVQVVELKKQTHAFLIVQPIEDARNDGHATPITDAKVEIVPIKGGKQVAMKENPSGSGQYEIVVEPGQYFIMVKKIGYPVTQDKVNTNAGICKVQVRVQKCKGDQEGYDPIRESIENKSSQKAPDDLHTKKPKFLSPPIQRVEGNNIQKINLAVFRFIDIVAKKPIQNVYIRVVDDGNNKLYSYRSNEQGICRVMLKNKISRGRIIIEHQNYYDKVEEFSDGRQLSMDTTNNFYIIRKPMRGQISILIQNKPQTTQLNFYVQKESGHIVRKDNEVSQFNNQEDGIQVITFDNLSDKKGAMQLFACVPTLTHNIEWAMILLPQVMQPFPIPTIKSEHISHLPYFLMIGSIIDPYESFDLINQVLTQQQLSQYPNYIKEGTSPVIQSILHLPLYIITVHQDYSVCYWNIDNLTVDQTIPNVIQNNLQQILIFDDDNIIFLDTSTLNWVKRDDNNQWVVATHMQLANPAKCINKVGIDGLAVGSSNGLITMFTVRLDPNYIQLLKESEVREHEAVEGTDVDIDGPPVLRSLQIANDQIAFMSDRLSIWKVEKSIDKPLSLSLLKIIPLAGHEPSDYPLLSMVSLDFRVIAYGGSNGYINTIKVDTLDRGPSFMWTNESQVTSLQLVGEQGIFTQSQKDIAWTYVESLQEMKDQKTELIKRITPPFKLYDGEIHFTEGRLITFSQKGQMVMYYARPKNFPELGNFLEKSEFPGGLCPLNKETTYLAALTDLPRENFQFYLISHTGEQIQESVHGLKFVQHEGIQFIEIDTKCLQGIWKVCARLQNTEKLKQQLPKIYYINFNGIQQLFIPSTIPQSKKQIYQWQVGTLLPNYQSMTSSSNFTDGALSKFPTHETSTQYGKINCILQFSPEEFISAGEDRSLILWDSRNFQVKKIIPNAHNSEILSLYKMTDQIIVSGCKTGEIRLWKRVDVEGNFLLQREIHFHDKSVHSIISIENNATLVSASDDRRIILTTVLNGLQEVSETVDKTFVNSLVKYQKDGFAGGFPDGRIKIWRKEKSGQKIVLKTLRTLTTLKVQSLYLITPSWMFVAGQEKQGEMYNLDTGIKLKIFKDGHQSAMLTSCSHSKKYILSGGSDGRIVVWNTETGLLTRSFDTGVDEVKQILISEGLVIMTGTTGQIKVWQDIIPYIEGLVLQDIEAQKQKEMEEAALKI